MTNIFSKHVATLSAFEEIKRALGKKEYPIALSGVSSVHKALFASFLPNAESCINLIICPDETFARKLSGDINSFSDSNSAFFYPSKEFNPNTPNLKNEDFSNIVASREFENARLTALSRARNKNGFICASAEAFIQKTISPKALSYNTILIAEDSKINLKELAKKLAAIGYERRESVNGIGQFAIRGDIFDVFPVASSAPLRTELWGEDVDSISYFDIDTQRRTQRLEIFEIPPCAEEFTADESSETDGTTSDLTAYVSGAVVICEYNECLANAKAAVSRHIEDLKATLENKNFDKREISRFENFYSDFETLLADITSNFPTIIMNTFLTGRSKIKYKKLINVSAAQTSPWSGSSNQLNEELSSYLSSGYNVVLACSNEKTMSVIKSDLEESGVVTPKNAKNFSMLNAQFSGGYEFTNEKLALIAQVKTGENRQVVKLYKSKKRNAFSSLSELNPGDLVVHAHYGIGRFKEIGKLEVDGLLKDYITIQYSGEDVLHVPVTQLELVSRYIAPRDDDGVKLNKLSGTAWAKTRSNVKKAIKDMALELTKLYAVREKSKGFAFAPDDDFQNDFEARFPYTETDDQLKCIAEIKNDMQSPRPMERLLCGDVGFGKTEVALRAAFKCAEEGKQCAILAPTTVLAWQHYKTALQRFEHFPVNIEHLSRFRSAKQKKGILEKLADGKIDIIIGTHSLIAKSVKFKDLGLAVIDEEQRFGVSQKEKFKEAFSGVDILTLSATPIPRTLNMAMSGIRDMSVIEEPPQDRHPVQTYVAEEDGGLMKAAISREIKRGGQVYFIHNRVETIAMRAGELKRSFPDAKIAYAHGQMDEGEVGAVWEKLVDGEIDILVCTTIIETGVDVPNVNTLIIEDADRFGLSQLYQLRGRVGRSNRRAYAYFFYKKGKVLTEIAEKRLKAMREFTQFGSGFRIAMRDLEIRGAGSILGGRQHGHMEAVGYEMYIKLLNEAVNELKAQNTNGNPQSGALPGAPQKRAAPANSLNIKRSECLIDLKVGSHIPEEYIESVNRRLEIYRKISTVTTREDALDLTDELIDRFGEPPKDVLNLIEISMLRNMACDLGIKNIYRRTEKKVTQLFFDVDKMFPQQLMNLSREFKGRVTINGAERYFSVKFQPKEGDLELLGKVLSSIIEN